MAMLTIKSETTKVKVGGTWYLRLPPELMDVADVADRYVVEIDVQDRVVKCMRLYVADAK